MSFIDDARRALEAGAPGAAIDVLRRGIARSSSEEERANASLHVAEVYRTIGDYHAGLDWAAKAMLIRPEWCRPYVELGRCNYFIALGEAGGRDIAWFARSVHWFERALATPPVGQVEVLGRRDIIHEVSRYLNVGYARLGRVADARRSCVDGLEVKTDESLLHNLRAYC